MVVADGGQRRGIGRVALIWQCYDSPYTCRIGFDPTLDDGAPSEIYEQRLKVSARCPAAASTGHGPLNAAKKSQKKVAS